MLHDVPLTSYWGSFSWDGCVFLLMCTGISLQICANTGMFVMVFVGIISALHYECHEAKQQTPLHLPISPMRCQ